MNAEVKEGVWEAGNHSVVVFNNKITMEVGDEEPGGSFRLVVIYLLRVAEVSLLIGPFLKVVGSLIKP